MQEETIIHLQHLTKHFKKIEAVSDLNLEVYRGDVFGFLGPNGAGKSTTIRMMLSLVKPTSGEIFVFGKNLLQSRNEILRKIGCIVERPDFYSYLSAEKNLEVFAKLSGIVPTKNKIAELIQLVGLTGRGKDKVKTYSHGMKQRLGIAQTLIHDPELIILDEPTTGLDPQGIIDVRNLIRRLQHDFGKTVFLSSHQLNEVEQIASRMAILNKGKTVVQGRVSDLLSSHDLIVSVEVIDVMKTKEIINQSQWREKFKDTANSHLDFHISKNEIPELNKFLNERGIEIFGMEYRRKLEDYFLSITNENKTNPVSGFSS